MDKYTKKDQELIIENLLNLMKKSKEVNRILKDLARS